MGALQQVNLDTIQCERKLRKVLLNVCQYRDLRMMIVSVEFAASEPVVGLPEGALLQCFARLRQLLDLFMGWDWPVYFHDYGSDSGKYNLVTPNMAILLLEK